jgi:hypothetical protein
LSLIAIASEIYLHVELLPAFLLAEVILLLFEDRQFHQIDLLDNGI